MIASGLQCPCCGADSYASSTVLWTGLINEWELSSEEAAYVNLQQGFHCTACGSNLRAMVLARALIRAFGGREPLADFVRTPLARELRILEINEAATLTQFLSQIPGHTIVRFPEIDMKHLPFADNSFDVVVHSDTLEHVDDPVRGLAECRRVLGEQGVLCFTVPIIVGRLTRRREGLPPSYHLGESASRDDVLVHTEYGADVWTQVLEAGFSECRIVALAPPAAHALIALG